MGSIAVAGSVSSVPPVFCSGFAHWCSKSFLFGAPFFSHAGYSTRHWRDGFTNVLHYLSFVALPLALFIEQPLCLFYKAASFSWFSFQEGNRSVDISPFVNPRRQITMCPSEIRE